MTTTGYTPTNIGSIVSSTSTPSTTTYTIAGSSDAVQASIDEIFQDYNPWGYGTLIASDQIAGGSRVAVIKRANSCD
jgi:hypothetical protein